MYDRNRDFVSFDNSGKSYFDLPSKEVYGFYNPKDNVWMCEVINHSEFSLKQFNTGTGRLFKLSSINPQLNHDAVKEILIERYPGADVTMYYNIDDWIDDKEAARVL